MLRLPIEFIGPNSCELARADVREGNVAGREKRFDNDEVDVVAQVGPDAEEEDEVRPGNCQIKVVEDFGRLYASQ